MTRIVQHYSVLREVNSSASQAPRPADKKFIIRELLHYQGIEQSLEGH